MSIPIISTIIPYGSGLYPVVYVDHVRGAYRSVATTGIRDLIPNAIRGTGMLVHTQDDGKSYRLIGGISNSSWVEQVTAGAGSGFSQTFAVATGNWTVTHNLGYFPAVTAFNNATGQIFGSLLHNNSNSLSLRFNSPVAGILYCS